MIKDSLGNICLSFHNLNFNLTIVLELANLASIYSVKKHTLEIIDGTKV